MSLSCTVFEIAKYWSKIADLILRHLYLVPHLWVIQSEFGRDFWRQKTGVPELSYGVICVILRLAVLIQYRRVTDGQTDGRTKGRTDTRRQNTPR